jgi:hypothetical protein
MGVRNKFPDAFLTAISNRSEDVQHGYQLHHSGRTHGRLPDDAVWEIASGDETKDDYER